MKGAIATGNASYYPFAEIPGHSQKKVSNRKKIIEGSYFHQGFVKPALMEKYLKGVAIQVDSSIKDEAWLAENTLITAYLPDDSARSVVIRDLSIKDKDLPVLDDILKTCMDINHSSKKIGRYYVPLLINWVKSYSYSNVNFDSRALEWSADTPLPFTQLVKNYKIASEVTSWPGGDTVFYSLLASVAKDCDGATTDRLAEFISANKSLCMAARSIPVEICPMNIQRRVVDSNVRLTFQ